AQSANQISKPEIGARVNPAPPASVLPAVDGSAVANSGDPSVEASTAPEPPLRIERLSLAGGAELLTIFGRLEGMRADGPDSPEVPLLGVVRDTLGDDNPENDRLRYVWMLTYTKPTLRKRIAAAIPFLYQPVGNKRKASSGPPAPILDLANARRETWNRFFWYGLQHAFFDTYGLPLKASSRTYRQNQMDYRSAHVTEALAILGNYQNLQQRAKVESDFLVKDDSAQPQLIATSLNGNNSPGAVELKPGFTIGEMLELRARLLLSGKFFGGLFGPDKYSDTVRKYSTKSLDRSGHNWELLRQQAEADGLYFEPLTMPDGTATHAMLWIAKSDLAEQGNRRFSGRFFNIKNPWTDSRLKEWTGYSETRFFDEQNRQVSKSEEGVRRREMIPLAVYGLNHPKIPALLIDFRNGFNPKKREMSGRLFSDVAKNILSLSSFGNIPYLAGRKAYGFLTGRRGMDVNQPSRVRSYSELKLLLAFNSSIDPALRSELERRLENVSLNPLSNDTDSEIKLARQQYDALLSFARRDDGLPAKIERDRREEMVPLVHGPFAQFMIGLGNVLTFGRYVHRENATPELTERMEVARRIKHHTQFLREVAKSSPQIEVVWNMTEVRSSLRFLADRATAANGSSARAAALVFEHTNETETRVLCLDVLSRINDKTARKEMLRIFRDQQPQSEWRSTVAARLRKAVYDDVRMKPAEARSVLTEVGQP
ncbi:MAG TPA: hypothetical protein VJT50_16125, partial [Pyrinomonadaceae bacterium]|nr:hypothetical protein [Pyrinomonadaceae bacterium]